MTPSPINLNETQIIQFYIDNGYDITCPNQNTKGQQGGAKSDNFVKILLKSLMCRNTNVVDSNVVVPIDTTTKLEDLPPEIMLQILSNVSLKEVVSLSAASKSSKQIVNLASGAVPDNLKTLPEGEYIDLFLRILMDTTNTLGCSFFKMTFPPKIYPDIDKTNKYCKHIYYYKQPLYSSTDRHQRIVMYLSTKGPKQGKKMSEHLRSLLHFRIPETEYIYSFTLLLDGGFPFINGKREEGMNIYNKLTKFQCSFAKEVAGDESPSRFTIPFMDDHDVKSIMDHSFGIEYDTKKSKYIKNLVRNIARDVKKNAIIPTTSASVTRKTRVPTPSTDTDTGTEKRSYRESDKLLSKRHIEILRKYINNPGLKPNTQSREIQSNNEQVFNMLLGIIYDRTITQDQKLTRCIQVINVYVNEFLTNKKGDNQKWTYNPQMLEYEDRQSVIIAMNTWIENLGSSKGSSLKGGSTLCQERTIKNPETGRCVKIDGVIGKRILAMSNPKTPANLMRRAMQIRVSSANDPKLKKELSALVALVKKHGYAKMANDLSDLLSAEQDRKLTTVERKEMKRLDMILNMTPTTERITRLSKTQLKIIL